ncbi:SDR family NAD(P)-dependent oxidoreductase [Kiloniella spongiae]|uniref:SDR family NAD(P)-dependent oxidoreductase n=1 Tax=Kiloniella spongiae TaxID=1489064 RepID=UPI00069AA2F7|nr:SDR family NAD(P)-dependent oxidoreductase [Kiloniella spongiae]
MTTHKKIIIKSEDVENFSKLSGDVNPIHIDKEYTRRTFYGRPIVHGALATIRCLGELLYPKIATTHIQLININFKQPVFCDEVCFLKQTTSQNKIRFELCDNTQTLISASLTLKDTSIPSLNNTTDLLPPTNNFSVNSHSHNPNEMDEIQITKFYSSSPPPFNSHFLNNLQGSLSTPIPIPLLYALCGSSYSVGMRCPGLYSILANLKIQFGDIETSQNYHCRSLLFRHNIVKLEMKHSHFSATIDAFFRPKPLITTNFEKVLNVTPHLTDKKRSLVVGGSRGIGALAVKLLVASGFKTVFTFAQSEGTASELAKNIKANGYSVEYQKLTISEKSNVPLASIKGAPFDILLYCATPPLVFNHGSWDEALYQKYYHMYVNGLKKLLQIKNSSLLTKGATVIIPSTQAINEKTPGLNEYIRAKEQAEKKLSTFCSTKHWKIRIKRLPILPTDLTNRPGAVFNNDEVKEVCSLLGIQGLARVNPTFYAK